MFKNLNSIHIHNDDEHLQVKAEKTRLTRILVEEGAHSQIMTNIQNP